MVTPVERGVVILAATNSRRCVGFERDPSTRLVPRLRKTGETRPFA